MLVLIKIRQQEQWGGSISNTLFLNTQTVRRVAVCFFLLYIKHIFLRLEARLIVTHKVSHHKVNKDDSDHQRYQSRAEQIFFFLFSTCPPHLSVSPCLPLSPLTTGASCLLFCSGPSFISSSQAINWHSLSSSGQTDWAHRCLCSNKNLDLSEHRGDSAPRRTDTQPYTVIHSGTCANMLMIRLGQRWDLVIALPALSYCYCCLWWDCAVCLWYNGNFTFSDISSLLMWIRTENTRNAS